MTQLQKNPSNLILNQAVSPYQLRIAKELSQSMADNQVRELLASDLLYKVGNLALIQEEILKNNPEAHTYTDYILRAFTYHAAEHLK